MKNKNSLIKKDKKSQVPFNVFKKAMVTTCLSATLVAGSMGFLAGCDQETIPSEVGFSNLTLYSGENTPNINDNPGVVGDFYFETDTFNLFKYSEENGWELLGCLKGTNGIDGTNGSKLYSGPAVPTIENTPAEDGDYYIETDTFDFYEFDNSEWIKIGNLKGSNGSVITIGGDGYWYIDGVKQQTKATGDKGDPGITPNVGNNGNWWVGADDTGVPATTIPEIKEGIWWVDTYNTGVKATGTTPHIGENGNWYIGTEDTGVPSRGDDGADAKYITSAERITDAWGIETKFKFTFSDNSYVETNSFNNVMENYYYPARSAEDINELFGKGVENIQLEQNITTTTPIVFPIGTEGNVKDICIDLNNFEFNYSYANNTGDTNRLKVKEYTVVTFKDGDLNITSELGYTHATLRVMEKGSVVFDNVNYTSNGSAIVVWGASANDNQVIKVRNSNIVGGAYALSTQNQHQDPTTGVKIELENSTFTSSSWVDGNSGSTKYDTTGILINIPCHATIKNCEITGHKQAMIVRGGEVKLENCTLVSTGLELVNNPDAMLYNTPNGDTLPNWIDDGNDIPTATLVVGNYGNNAYNFTTTVDLINTNIVAKKFSLGGEIWAQANQGENAKPVTINFDNKSVELTQSFGVCNYMGEGVYANVTVYDFQTLQNLYEYGSYMFEGANVLPVLNKDIVIADEEVTVEDKLKIEYYNDNLPQAILRGYKVLTPMYDIMCQAEVSVTTSEGLEYALDNYPYATIELKNDIAYDIDFYAGINASELMRIYGYNNDPQIDTNNHYIYINNFDFANFPATVNVSTANELMFTYSAYEQFGNYNYRINLTNDIDFDNQITTDNITAEDMMMLEDIVHFINNYNHSEEPMEGMYRIICSALENEDLMKNVKVGTAAGIEYLMILPQQPQAITLLNDIDLVEEYLPFLEQENASFNDVPLEFLAELQSMVDEANKLNTNEYRVRFDLEGYYDTSNIEITSATELKYALENLCGNHTEIRLNGDIYSEDIIRVYNTNKDVRFRLDLNGHTINNGMYFYATTEGNFVDVNIFNGTIGNTENEDCIYGLVFMGDNYQMNISLENVNAYGYYGGLSTNGKYKNTGYINAINCTFMGSMEVVGDTSVGAYLPGGAEYTFDNCTFIGYDGIYTKNGNLNLINCTVVALGEFNQAVFNGDGCTGTGSALIVDSATGYGSEHDQLHVYIIGGTLASKYGFDIYEVSTAATGLDKIVYYAEINLSQGVRLIGTDNTTVNGEEISKENDQVILNGSVENGDYMIDEESSTFWTEFENQMNQPVEPNPGEPFEPGEPIE